MSKFNLINYQKIEGDEHIERRLQEQHGKEVDQVSEGQLKPCRVDESESITEKQLDKVRIGGGETLVEKMLDDSTSKIVQHRNADGQDRRLYTCHLSCEYVRTDPFLSFQNEDNLPPALFLLPLCILFLF